MFVASLDIEMMTHVPARVCLHPPFHSYTIAQQLFDPIGAPQTTLYVARADLLL